MDTSNIKNEELIAIYAIDYFVALFDISTNFTSTSEKILARPGYRDSNWAKNLFITMRPANRLLSSGHYAPKDESELRLLKVLTCASDADLDEILSREIVAIFCAADNILASMYHENILYKQYRIAKDSHKDTRQLHRAQLRFSKLKKHFLSVAFDGNLTKVQSEKFRVEHLPSKTSILRDALTIAPVIYQYCPRYLTSDWSLVANMRQKYRSQIELCEATMSIPDMEFEFKTNGKF